MHKVVTTRPRHGRAMAKLDKRSKRRRDKNADPDSLPMRETTGRRKNYGWSAKEFTDHIEPLRRYLRKQVGRPWNKVFSEICERLPVRSMNGNHIRDHLDWEVETKTCLVDGIPHSLDLRGPRPVYPNELYVCPKTGILNKMKEKRRDKVKLPPKELDIGGIIYRNIDGNWYRLRMKPLPDPRPRKAFLSDLLHPDTIWCDYRQNYLRGMDTWTYGGNVVTDYCPRKEAANKKELKKIREALKKAA